MSVYEEVNEENQAREYLKRKRLVKPKDQKAERREFFVSSCAPDSEPRRSSSS